MFSIATDIAAVAAKHFLKPKTPENTQGGNYNITGQINHVHVLSTSQFSTDTIHRSSSLESAQPNHGFSRSVSSPAQIAPSTCSNWNTSNKKKQQGNPNKKQQGSPAKKQNANDSGKYCTVVIPQEGNYEIKIRKFESNFAKMNLSTSNSIQNAQKPGSNNSSKQNSNKPKQQNGNQQQFNGNQKQQTGNPKPQNSNNQNGKQKYQNGNQNSAIKPNNNGQSKAKTKDEQVKQRQPSDLKFGNNNYAPNNIGGPQNRRFNALNGPRSASSNDQSTWMYLGRLKIGTNEFEIRNYLLQKFPGYNFAVEALPLYKDAKLPSFKVNVDDRILDEFQNLEHWPNGVKIFKFKENFKN